ncbi:hypothetical protein CY34DRAFT_726842 [Suillus luteus UH-Slu-Lm8-n1]|uniref:Uncharacterized protein n=1 Tax=Suillus luteus UH-Slu-Lm8-n1 TaxID=930992 RepID=A0A0C9Z6K9_9AGAM|nr:hypothetical protein CY34DRAFT_726842 [Suillus luteus UH-Slu-Lm8-n1]
MSMRNQFLPLCSTHAQSIQSKKRIQHPPCIVAILCRNVVLEASGVVVTASLMLTVGVLNRRTAKPAHKTSAPYSVMRT